MDRQEQWYREHLPLRTAELIVDVGANVGRLSQFFFDETSDDTRLLSLEPIPSNCARIEARIREARASERWSVERCAISATDGEIDIRVLDAPWGTNGVVVDTAVGRTIRVPSRRLEDLPSVRAASSVVVKVDVEGHEYAFLDEAVTGLDNVTAWAVELHAVRGHRLEDVLALFVDAGFRVVAGAARRSDPVGAWVSVDVHPSWSWDMIDGRPSMRDGVPSEFKMLHVLALRV